MENILVVVFDKEAKAEQGFSVLNQLDCDGIITIYAGSVIQKDADGSVRVTEPQGNFPSQTIAGTALGGVIGLLAGPAGSGLGASLGGLTGIIRDFHAAGVNTHFVDEVAAILEPGKFAVIADVSEERLTPVDSRMEALGGVVFRSPKQSFDDELLASEIRSLRIQIDQLKAELPTTREDRRGKLEKQIANLSRKLEKTESEANEWAKRRKREVEAQVETLEKKAAKAQGEAKESFDRRINQLRNQYEDSAAKLRNVTAKKLRQVAAKIEKAG